VEPLVHFSAGDVAVLVLYLLAVLWVGFAARRHLREGDAVGYLVAGRAVSLPAFVATLVATWYGGILGVGEFSYSYGVSNWVVFGLPYYVFALLFAWLLAPRVREAALFTIPDRLYGIYGRVCGLFGSLLTFCMTTPAPYTLILGVLFQLLFGGNLLLWLVVGTVLSTVYLYRGGLQADVRVNVLEFLMMFGGFAIILPYLVTQYGGLEFLRQRLPPLHLTWHGGNSVQYIVVWFFIALWTLIDPGFHQRCYAAKSPQVARWGIVVSVCCWFVFDLLTTSSGLYARAILGDSLQDPKFAYPVLAERVLPPVAKGIFCVSRAGGARASSSGEGHLLRGHVCDRDVDGGELYLSVGGDVRARPDVALARRRRGGGDALHALGYHAGGRAGDCAGMAGAVGREPVVSHWVAVYSRLVVASGRQLHPSFSGITRVCAGDHGAGFWYVIGLDDVRVTVR